MPDPISIAEPKKGRYERTCGGRNVPEGRLLSLVPLLEYNNNETATAAANEAAACPG